MKIIMFGSRAKGTARAESDLDVLIIVNNGRELTDWIADAAFEIQMGYRVSLEPIIAALDELFPLRSYFLSNMLRYGEERRNLVNLADEYLAGAEHAAECEYWRLAIDVAYNAAELAIKSLLLKFDDDLPDPHGGVVGRFGELYIKTRWCEKTLGRRLNQALERRNHARYKYQALIKREDAETVMELAKSLLELAEKELSIEEAP